MSSISWITVEIIITPLRIIKDVFSSSCTPVDGWRMDLSKLMVATKATQRMNSISWTTVEIIITLLEF